MGSIDKCGGMVVRVNIEVSVTKQFGLCPVRYVEPLKVFNWVSAMDKLTFLNHCLENG